MPCIAGQAQPLDQGSGAGKPGLFLFTVSYFLLIEGCYPFFCLFLEQHVLNEEVLHQRGLGECPVSWEQGFGIIV